MGFERQLQPDPPPTVISLNDAIERELERQLAIHFPLPDPFLVCDPCPHNGGGAHEAFPSCGDLVCRHCARVFW
jgi:hypothetical protein